MSYFKTLMIFLCLSNTAFGMTTLGTALPRVVKKESQWLRSLGIAGEAGLYADENIEEGKVICWYTGKIYDSLEDLYKVMPEENWDEIKAAQYVLDVEIPVPPSKGKPVSDGKLKYLYSVSGYEPVGGSDVCDACFINHAPWAETNVTFKSLKSAEAYKGYAPAVLATRAIKKGEELIVYYSDVFDSELQFKAESYRNFIKTHYPDQAVEETDEDTTTGPDESSDNDENSDNSDSQDESKLYQKFVRILKKGDSFVRKADRRAYLQFNFSRAFFYLDTALQTYSEGKKILAKMEDPRIGDLGHPKAKLVEYNIYERIGLVHWNKANLQIQLGHRSADRKQKLKWAEKEFSSLTTSFDAYSRARAVGSLPGKIFKDLKIAMQDAEVRIRLLQGKRKFSEVQKEDLEHTYSVAMEAKIHGDQKINEDRKAAILGYRYALFLLEGPSEDDYVNKLKGDLYWHLAECHNDDLLFDREKAVLNYQNALRIYQSFEGSEFSSIPEEIKETKKSLKRLTSK